jgi:hypothetical protein
MRYRGRKVKKKVKEDRSFFSGRSLDPIIVSDSPPFRAKVATGLFVDKEELEVPIEDSGTIMIDSSTLTFIARAFGESLSKLKTEAGRSADHFGGPGKLAPDESPTFPQIPNLSKRFSGNQIMNRLGARPPEILNRRDSFHRFA